MKIAGEEIQRRPREGSVHFYDVRLAVKADGDRHAMEEHVVSQYGPGRLEVNKDLFMEMLDSMNIDEDDIDEIKECTVTETTNVIRHT